MPKRGFAEKTQANYEAGRAPRSVTQTHLKMDSAGRILIPAEMRAAMLAKPGDGLVAEVIDGELKIVAHDWIMHRVREEAAKFRAAHPNHDFQAELDAYREEEARHEAEKWARIERDAVEHAKNGAGDR